MNIDLKFDYTEALKRHGLTQAQVDMLRESAKKHVIIPKSLTNKQVIIRNVSKQLINSLTSLLSFRYSSMQPTATLIKQRKC